MSDNDDKKQRDAELEAERGAIVEEREALTAERQRTEDILHIAEEHNAMELAREYLSDQTKSGRDMLEAILKRKSEKQETREEPKPMEHRSSDIGLTEKEKERYSVVRALRALAFPDNNQFRKDAGFEIEASEAAAKAYKRDARGIMIPQEVLTRASDLLVGTANIGGDTVETELRAGSFIDILTNMMLVRAAGATVLTGLEGNVAIPRQTGRATTAWLAEDGTATASAQNFDQVTLTPHTVANRTQISRRMLLQSAIAIEAFVQRDLATGLALEMDRTALDGDPDTTASANEPRGILHTTGIGAVEMGTNGGAIDYDSVVDLRSAVAVDNALTGSLRFMTDSAVVGSMMKTRIDTGSGEHIVSAANPGSLLGYPLLESNQVPGDKAKGTGSNLNCLIFGNWADLLIGQWSGVDLMVNPYTADDAGAVIVTAFMDVDAAVRHAESFAAIDDIIA